MRLPKDSRLTWVKFSHRKDRDYLDWFKCRCGVEKIIYRRSATRGLTKSCGCLCKEKSGLNSKRFFKDRVISKSNIYFVYKNMMNRCYRKVAIDYKNYGGRGIRVCKRWRDSFMAFFKDVGYPPQGLMIDRINNDGNYEPSNVRWATRLQQNNNKRKQ